MSWMPSLLVADRLRQPAPTERRDWLSDDDWMFEGTATASGARVNRDSAMRLSTVWACVRLLTNTVATLPRDIVITLGPTSFALDRPDEIPPWLSSPYPADPTMTATEHFAQVTASLLLDGNAFTYVPGSVDYPDNLIVLDPRRVEIKADGLVPYYIIRNSAGEKVAEVDAMSMLHSTWLKMPGALRGLSPVESARQGIGLGLSAEEFGSRFFGQGAALSFGVEVPGSLTEDQKEDLRKALRKKYGGTQNSHSVGVLTGGAKFATGLGITNEQMQFLELRKFGVEDIARWFGVPPHLVGSQEPGASSYNSVEQRSLEFRQYSVLPLVRRIEDAYQRLVDVPARLRPDGRASFRFNLEGLARADMKTRYESYQLGINGGFLKPNDARSLENLGPVPGGDATYMQSQMVPLGTSPAPTRSTDEAA
jgi:HK97 family phage portal protein